MRIVRCGAVRILACDFHTVQCGSNSCVAMRFGKTVKPAPRRTYAVPSNLISKALRSSPGFFFCESRTVRFGAGFFINRTVRCGADFYFGTPTVRCGATTWYNINGRHGSLCATVARNVHLCKTILYVHHSTSRRINGSTGCGAPPRVSCNQVLSAKCPWYTHPKKNKRSTWYSSSTHKGCCYRRTFSCSSSS